MRKNIELNLTVPGKHNVSNATAVLAVARQLKISDKISINALSNFSGTWRRMEFRGKINGAKIYDDYGHHPTEIKATLEGARDLLANRKSHIAYRRLYCVFQPHQYQRTYKLFNQFLTAFDAADKTIILPIYSVAGREKESIKKKVSSKKLVSAIHKLFLERSRGVIYINSLPKAKNYLKKNLRTGDVAIVMGAGDINKLTQMLFKNRKK